jgi:hypothetical protein
MIPPCTGSRYISHDNEITTYAPFLADILQEV